MREQDTNTLFFEESEIYQSHFLNDVPWPSLVLLETSSWCNLRCPMCPRTIGNSPSGTDYGNMQLDLLDRLESLFQHTDSITLSWIGEPLINKKLPEIIQRLKEHGLHVHITSNGMLLTDKIAETLVEIGLDSLAISIDAAEPELYRKIRVGGDLKVIKHNILALNQLKDKHASQRPNVGMAFVAMPENVEQMPDMVRLGHELGVSLLNIAPVDTFAGLMNFAHPDQGALGPKKIAKQAFLQTQQLANDLNVEIELTSSQRFYWELGDLPADSGQFRNDYTPDYTKQIGLRKACGVPWTDTVIGDNGDIHPCCVSKRVLGNVYEQSFEEIWWGENYQDFRAKLLSSNPPTECWSCQRASWEHYRKADQLIDAIQIEEKEFLGQGWAASYVNQEGVPFRSMKSQSTFFLKYSGQPYLVLELGTFEALELSGDVLVNDVNVGTYDVDSGWHCFTYHLPDLESEFVKITLTGQPSSQKLFLFKGFLCTSSKAWQIRVKYSAILAPLRKSWPTVQRLFQKLAVR